LRSLDSTQNAAKREHDIRNHRNPEGSLAAERCGDNKEDNQRCDGKDQRDDKTACFGALSLGILAPI
jgi:hypothetical protein